MNLERGKTCWLIVGLTMFWLLGAAPSHVSARSFPAIVQDAEVAAEVPDRVDRIGYRVQVTLPIDSRVATSVKQALQRLIDRTGPVLRPEDRPHVVLEFQTDRGKTGTGSEFEACVSLARFLLSAETNSLNTVAYIPRSAVLMRDRESVAGELNGHAVLVAIAANQIAMDENTRIGAAGIGEKSRDQLLVDVYRGIAAKRLLFPVPLVLSMIDPDRSLFRVTTDRRTVFVDQDELDNVEQAGSATATRTFSKSGDLARFDSKQLHEDRLIQYLTKSRTGLARKLDLQPGSLEGDPTEGKPWQAVQIELPGYIDSRTVNWVIRSLQQETAAGKSNLIVFSLDQVDGDLDACLRLAKHIAQYDPANIRTVAHVRGPASGPVGLLALSTDHLIMGSDAILGGHERGDPDESPDEQWATVQPDIQEIARLKQQDWSVMSAMLDPSVNVLRYRNRDSGQTRLLSVKELETLPDADRWAELGPAGFDTGIDAKTAQQLYLARTIADDADQVQTFYQLESPIRTLRKSATDKWIENIAARLSSPLVAPWLLFGAMFFFSSEMSAPGLGIPGFLSAVCVMLFFWSQYLDGNANGLEILLFIVGVGFILVEMFLVPGFGVFGLGGLVMVIASTILASQKFLLPRSAEEIAQLPRSLMPVLAAVMGVVVALFALRKIIPNSPYLNRLILNSRRETSAGFEDQKDLEAVVDWSYLAGRTGETVTRLAPSGKARIDGHVYDVISRGQLIDKGVAVSVVEAVANRVVVAVLVQREN